MIEHLPGDLRGATAAALKANVRHLLAELLGDEELHAEVVAAGEFRFRQAFVKDMGAFYRNNRAGCDELANLVFRFAVQHWRERHPHIEARQWLDRYLPVSPLTEQEINDAWEIEIGSSDAAMKTMYEGSRRHRKGNDLGMKVH